MPHTATYLAATVLLCLSAVAIEANIEASKQRRREQQQRQSLKNEEVQPQSNPATTSTDRETHPRASLAVPVPAPPPLIAAEHVHDNKHHLLLACTGSVATIKLPQILSALLSRHGPARLSIRILLTKSARHFLQGQAAEQPTLAALAAIPGVDGIYGDEDEWRAPPGWTRGAPILHIELRRWADLLVIAPLSADSLAKLALGRSEDLISSVVRAWDTTGLIDGGPREIFSGAAVAARSAVGGDGMMEGGTPKKKRIVVAPAMNTAMWNHPVTTRHLKVLEEEWGVQGAPVGQEGFGWFEVLRPVEKTLACGDTGSGAMREWKEIVAVIERNLGLASHVDEQEAADGSESMVVVDREAIAAVTIS